MKDFLIRVADNRFKEFIFCDLFYGEDHWVEISQETGETIIQFYSPRNKEFWDFPLDDTLIALEAAKNDLLGGE